MSKVHLYYLLIEVNVLSVSCKQGTTRMLLMNQFSTTISHLTTLQQKIFNESEKHLMYTIIDGQRRHLDLAVATGLVLVGSYRSCVWLSLWSSYVLDYL